MTTIKNSMTHADSLATGNPVRTATPMKPSSSTVPSDSSDILSAAVLHKRRPSKRVRFALKLEPVEEDSLPSSREITPSFVSRPNKKVTDPWRHNAPFYGAYVEYLEKQDAFSNHGFETRRFPPPPPPPPPEPGAQPPTYTHTFVIQSQSPEIVIDSITVSTPSLHLPRILNGTKKSKKHQLQTLDSYLKQQLILSTSPRMTHTKKLTNSSNQKNQYSAVQAALKRAELSLPPTNGLHSNNKVTRPENSYGFKSISDYYHPKKLTEITSKPLPGLNNPINRFFERSPLPNYSKKPRMHNRSPRINTESNTPTPYFCHNHDSDPLLQPFLHSNR